MASERSAEKLRRAAERHARHGKSTEGERRKSDAESAEVHGELIQPGESKARPRSDGEPEDRGRSSNAGNDGP
jgi:hypothetical protein